MAPLASLTVEDVEVDVVDVLPLMSTTVMVVDSDAVAVMVRMLFSDEEVPDEASFVVAEPVQIALLETVAMVAEQ